MSCENDPDHTKNYCEHCSTCHDCLEETSDANELIINKLGKKLDQAIDLLSIEQRAALLVQWSNT